MGSVTMACRVMVVRGRENPARPANTEGLIGHRHTDAVAVNDALGGFDTRHAIAGLTKPFTSQP